METPLHGDDEARTDDQPLVADDSGEFAIRPMVDGTYAAGICLTAAA